MDILGKLFGSLPRVKMMRFFLFRPGEEGYTLETIHKQCRLPLSVVKKELKLLEQVGLIKPLTAASPAKREWRLNPKFPLTRQLKYLLDADFRERRAEIGERLKKAGPIKLLIIAGSLIGDENGRADLVVVGDGLRRSLLEQAIKGLEVEVGRELVYAHLETRDFLYRLSASDKFIRDLLEYPHEKLINKLDF